MPEPPDPPLPAYPATLSGWLPPPPPPATTRYSTSVTPVGQVHVPDAVKVTITVLPIPGHTLDKAPRKLSYRLHLPEATKDVGEFAFPNIEPLLRIRDDYPTSCIFIPTIHLAVHWHSNWCCPLAS